MAAMADTTLFVADDDVCASLFVAVRRPLAQPITRVGFNPLTRQMLGGASWDAGEGAPASSDEAPPPSVRNEPAAVRSVYDASDAKPVAPVTPMLDDEDRAREASAPARLRALPHAVVRAVTGFELEALAHVLLGHAAPPARIVEPLDSDGFVEALATDAVEPLAMLDDEDLSGTLERWNARLAPSRRKVDVRALLAVRAVAREAIAHRGHVLVHIPRA